MALGTFTDAAGLVKPLQGVSVVDPSGNEIAEPSSVSRIVSAAASTNATSAKTSAGTLVGVIGYNAAAALRYLKLYDKASAPTVGTDTPKLTIAIPATTAFSIDFPRGLSFALGIAYALTTGSADADTGALTAADIVGLNVVYS